MITPVLLCGGGGTRMWPLSRKDYPKQFIQLTCEQTPFQQCALRFSNHSTHFKAPYIVTNEAYRFIAKKQLEDIKSPFETIILEPENKDTAAAILTATLHAARHDPKALILVAPSDHDIPDSKAFLETVKKATRAAQNGQIITFGINATHAETAYGYLKLPKHKQQGNAILPLEKFIEKPDLQTAKEMVASGQYKWNAGIFLFQADIFIQLAQKLLPDMFEHVQNALEYAQSDLSFLRLDRKEWSKIDSISIDYAMMEKIDNISVAPYASQWSDLGSWEAIWNHAEKDAQGVAVSENAHAIDCENSLLRSEDKSVALVGLGLKNIAAIAMKDAVLVVNMACTQSIKKAVEILHEKYIPQAVSLPKEHRPWGWFERISIGEHFLVKRIFVDPGASLSLQSHLHRAEHWVVVEGTARVTINHKSKTLSANESTYVPQGAIHRLENPGTQPVVLIEIQSGAYLAEDDITRYEDLYERV